MPLATRHSSAVIAVATFKALQRTVTMSMQRSPGVVHDRSQRALREEQAGEVGSSVRAFARQWMRTDLQK